MSNKEINRKSFKRGFMVFLLSGGNLILGIYEAIHERKNLVFYYEQYDINCGIIDILKNLDTNIKSMSAQKEIDDYFKK